MFKAKQNITFLLIVLSLFFKGQQHSYINFSVSNGLPSNNAYYVAQDSRGYFWIATDKGLARFNGYNFQIFNTNDGLSDNEVFDIYEDAENRIWFACYNGELPFFKNNTFYNRSNNKALSKLSRFSIGLKVMSDYNGTVFYLSQKGVVALNRSGALSEIVSNEISANSTLLKNEKNEVISISYDTVDVFLNNLTSGKSIRFSHQKKEVMPRINTKADMVNNSVFYSVANKLIMKDLSATPFSVIGEFENMIQFVKKAGPSTLWIGTKKGLYLFDYTKRTVVKKLFSEHSVSCVFEDNEKHLWVSTLDNGVFLIVNQNVELLNQQNGLNFNTCLNFTNINERTLLIGSNNFKFALIDSNGIRNIALPESQSNGLIRNAKADSKGNLYLVTAINVYKLNKECKVISNYKTAIRDLLFTGTDSMYVARISGVSKVKTDDFDKNANNLDAFFYRTMNLRHGTNFFYKSISGDIFCIGNKGVKQLNGIARNNIENDSLFRNNITDMVGNKDGIVFISSDINGIKASFRNKVYYINNKTGLPSNFVTSLMLDDNYNLWAGTAKGLVRIKYSTRNNEFNYDIKTYSIVNGLIDNSINDVAFFQKKIWLATSFGVCSFYESDLNSKNKAPVINIESVSINDSLYNTSVSSTVVTSYNRNNLNIRYVGVSSGSLNDIEYRYRMKGLEENWNLTRNIQLQYPSLYPGNYTFEIAAVNKKGVSSEVKRIFIIVTPAFYQTVWFKLMAAVLSVVILSLIVFLRIRSWRKTHELKENLLSSENKRLELEKEEINMQMRLIELEQKALRLHMNPHFIFNAINAINGFYASGEADTGKKYIGKLSQLLRMLLDYSSQKQISIKQEVDLLTNYFLLNQLRFQNKFEFSIQLDEKINAEQLAIPPLIIQPFVENALIHGIASLKTKGFVNVKLKIEKDFLLCEISDNGIGIRQSEIMNKDRIHISTGIKVTEERIKANYSGPIPGVAISDITDENGKCLGTKVVFRLNIEELY